MIPNIIIHAGMSKTGTTAIQKFFCKNKEWARQNGVHYPEAGRFDHSIAHHELFYAAASRKEFIRTPLSLSEQSFEGISNNLVKEIEDINAKNVLLSSEMIWNRIAFDMKALSRIQEALLKYRIYIVISLRDVRKHIESSYAQRVAGPQKYTGSIDEHIFESELEGAWEYSSRIEEFSSVFGEQNIFPYWYEDTKEDVLAPVMSILSISSPYSIPTRTNVTRSWACIKLFRISNIAARGNYRFIAKIIRNSGKFVDKILRIAIPDHLFRNFMSPLTENERRILNEKGFAEKRRVYCRYNLEWWKGPH